jgi:hypothetical protein
MGLKTEKEKHFLFLFSTDFVILYSKEAWDFPIVFGSQIQTVPIRTCGCVYCAEARDMSTSSSILALG